MATITVPPNISEGCLTPPSMMTRIRVTTGIMTVLMSIILLVTLTHCKMSTIAWIGIGILTILLLVVVYSSVTHGVIFNQVLKNCKRTNEYSAQKAAIMTKTPGISEVDAGRMAEQIMEATARAARDADKFATRQKKLLARAEAKRRQS